MLVEQWPTFDLILGDLTIPALEGAHLYWEIGRYWPQLTSRLICVTDGNNAGVIDHPLLRAASVPFLVKPFAPEALRDLVRRRRAELGAQPSPDPPQPSDGRACHHFDAAEADDPPMLGGSDPLPPESRRRIRSRIAGSRLSKITRLLTKTYAPLSEATSW